MKTQISSPRFSKQTRRSILLVALALAAYTGCVSAENTTSRVPLTPTEALNLGLDPGHDGLLFRVIQNSSGPVSKGSSINYAISPREQRGAADEEPCVELGDHGHTEIADEPVVREAARAEDHPAEDERRAQEVDRVVLDEPAMEDPLERARGARCG